MWRKEAPHQLLPPAREVKLFLLLSGWLQGPWTGSAGFSGALAGSSFAPQGKDKFVVLGGGFLFRGGSGYEPTSRALGAASQ